MKVYQYKMQWLFTKKEAVQALKLFGARSLTKICIRDIDLKVIATYSDMVQYPEQTAVIKTKQWIDKQYKDNRHLLLHVEFLRN